MSIAATKVEDARVINPDLDKWENRGTEHGLLEATQDDTPNLVSAAQIENARLNHDRVVELPVFNRFNATIESARACDPAPVYSDTALESITWNTLSFRIGEIPTRYKGNEFQMQEDFAHKLNSSIRDARSSIEDTIDTVLDTNKTQVLLNDTNAIIPFNAATDQWEVPQAEKSRMFNYLKGVVAQNDFGEQFRFVHSFGIQAEADFYINQGSGNDANTAFQFNGIQFYRSNRVTNAADQGTFYVLPVGSVAIVTWVDPQSKLGGQAGGSDSIVDWSTVNIPGLGDMGVKVVDKCVDDSGYTPGATSVQQRVYEYSMDYAIIPTYNSDLTTQVNSIIKGVLQTT